MHRVYKKKENRGGNGSDFVFSGRRGEEKGDNIDI